MPVVLNFVPSEQIAVVVEGIAEATLLTAIARDVRRMFRHLVGRWRVSLRPADRGRWRLELSGASGRHLWFFAAPVNRLAEIVVEKLDSFLTRSVAPLRPTAF
jgi:hypothetical protein